MPYHIIVYRDGLPESQFESTLNTEVPAIRQAIELLGYNEERVKVSIVVCQKRHHTRLVYQYTQEGDYVNPCVGLVVDAQGSELARAATAGGGGQLPAEVKEEGEDAVGCIVGTTYNEFYLNSHAAILGTNRPAKYVLVRDEIGLKVTI